MKKKKKYERVFMYTKSDIARLTGIHINTLRNKEKNGEIDPANLESVVRFIASYLVLKK